MSSSNTSSSMASGASRLNSPARKQQYLISILEKIKRTVAVPPFRNPLEIKDKKESFEIIERYRSHYTNMARTTVSMNLQDALNIIKKQPDFLGPDSQISNLGGETLFSGGKVPVLILHLPHDKTTWEYGSMIAKALPLFGKSGRVVGAGRDRTCLTVSRKGVKPRLASPPGYRGSDYDERDPEEPNDGDRVGDVESSEVEYVNTEDDDTEESQEGD